VSERLSGRCALPAVWRGWLVAVLALVLALPWAAAPAIAQEAAAQEGGALKPLAEADRAAFDDKLQAIDVRYAAAQALQKKLGDAVPSLVPVLRVRLADDWSQLLGRSVEFARLVAKKQSQGYEVVADRARALDDMARFGAAARAARTALWGQINVPDATASAVEEARVNHWLFDLIASSDALIRQLVDAVDAGRALGADVAGQEEALRAYVSERAVNNSVMLALAMNEVKGRKAALAVMPADGEVQAKVSVAEREVSRLAASLDSAVKLMNDMSLDTLSYRQQVIAATGEISTDIFDPRVLLSLAGGWLRSLGEMVVRHGPNLFLKLLLFIAIVLLFRRLAGIVQRLIEAALGRSQLQLSRLLRNMIVSFSRTLIISLGVLIALSQVGISLGPVLAGLGVAGFVIGFALQDTLSNFAAGMMILMYRPFDVGDIVEAGGVSGKVSHMSLVNTTILTFDNQTLVVPNNKIWGNVIKNVTSQRTRRVDLLFSVSYSDDIPRTEAILTELVNGHDRVLSMPEPLVRLHQLADSSVDFIVRPWVKTEDYWDVYWDLTRAVKLRFDQEGISIPFPQRDVHLFAQTPAADDARPLPGATMNTGGAAIK